MEKNHYKKLLHTSGIQLWNAAFYLTCMLVWSYFVSCLKKKLVSCVKKAIEYATASIGILWIEQWCVLILTAASNFGLPLRKDTAGTEKLQKGWEKLLTACMKIDSE